MIKDKEKYKLSLGPLSCFKKISSSKAYRLISLLDVIILLLNSHFLAYLVGFASGSALLQILCIVICECMMAWGIWLDLMKLKYIEAGKFDRIIKNFLIIRRVMYSSMAFIYLFFILGWVLVLMMSNGKHHSSSIEIIYKVHEMTFSERLWTSGLFVGIVFAHVLAYWLAEKLDQAKELLIIEQEDVIVSMSEQGSQMSEEDSNQEIDDSIAIST